MKPAQTPYLKVKDVAKLFGLSERTIRAKARTNAIPGVRLGRDWFFLEDVIRERIARESVTEKAA